ncbi:hypothetical protein VC83_00745 [Pseudogymnoascus destructans]|uniref:Chromo domain-containing protein n=2 Tax=Pseudogymnoascus destructans TaxID=655981 RepID=L8G848_PSED2|nr:uncharacterized protein VC83_00745 [Pseudogymnoascus destructans]ELR08818.1 hypothetical protein GMDG_03494 [Pseudogymnoascus destructans 20631-21]OAF62658.1 hypothetical protein VC83_00745 [Pseudogymnoascus destructans]
MASSSPPPGSGLGSGSDSESDQDVYIVKRILAEGGTDEERVFLIEWEGYPLEESTWEPEENILSKDTLKAWKEEKLRQREGLSQPLDTDEFEKRQEEHTRRKRRRERLGLPQQSKPSESESKGDSSSDEAEEADFEVPDDEGIPLSKKSQQAGVKRHDTTHRDDDTVMNDASTSEDRYKKEAKPTKIGTETKAKVHKAPIIEAPSATGYRGTAHRGPVSHSTDAPRERSIRGRSRTTGRGSHMAMSKPPKARRTIENRILTETRSKEVKAPQLFTSKRQERRFELGARGLADRAPAQLPRLMNPAEYRIRKKGSAPVPGGAQSTQTPVSAPGDQQPVLSSAAATAPMVSSLEEFIPRQETTAVEFGEEQPNHSPIAAFHPPTAPMGLTFSTPIHGHPASSEVQDAANILPSAPVRKVSLANYSAKQNGVAPKPVSMFNQAQRGLSETTLKSFFGDRQAQDDPIVLTFIDISVNNMAWGAALQQLQSKDLTFNHICRSTDVDNFKSEFNPTLLARGRVTAGTGDDQKVQDSISALGDYLRVNISGLLYNLESLNVIIYPTRCEEWKFIEFGAQLQHSGQLSFFSFTTPSKLVCPSYNREAESRMSKMRVDGCEDYQLLNRVIFGFSYQSLHQVDKKSPRDSFFLLFPNMTAPLAEHTAAWLRSSNKGCRIYSCQQAGSWRQFLKYTANPEGGSLIIHHKMISLIPRYPGLQGFLLNGLNNVWCIDEDFPKGKYLIRLFPHGGAVCLTSGFLSGEPEMALFFLNWFLSKRGSRASAGTWKLLVCRDVYKFVSEQAFSAAKRRAKLLETLPAGLTDSQIQSIATGSGLSMKNCKDRFDLMDVIGRLVRPKNEKERDLDAVLQPDDTRTLMVFADEEIKPSDDRELIRYFAYWSVLHLKSFRKFVAIGSKTSPKEHEEAVAQAPKISNSSGTKPSSENTPQDRPPSKSPGKSTWKHNGFASVDGANDDDDYEPTIEPKPGTTQTSETEDLNAGVAPEDLDLEVLKFIVETGVTYSVATDFVKRAKGNHDRATMLYEFSKKAKRQAEEAANVSVAAETPPVPPTPPVTEANIAIPSTDAVTTEDVVMEDAPPAAAEAAPSTPRPIDTNSPTQSNSPDAEPSSQTSNSGIITSEGGFRLVPRSVRSSGTVRNELNIRPGYVPPEDKEVYKVRRGRSGSVGRAVSRSRSGSSGVEEGEVSNGAASASVSPGGVLTPVTPVTPSERRKDQIDQMEGLEGAEEEKGEGKLSTLEWYAEMKLKGVEWNHIAVVGWEDAFRLLRVEYKKQ